MGVAAMTAADVRVENHAKPTIPKPPTRLSGCRRPASTGRTCGATAGSTTQQPTQMGHEYCQFAGADGRRTTAVAPLGG